jgi:hypothetical protein
MLYAINAIFFELASKYTTRTDSREAQAERFKVWYSRNPVFSLEKTVPDLPFASPALVGEVDRASAFSRLETEGSWDSDPSVISQKRADDTSPTFGMGGQKASSGLARGLGRTLQGSVILEFLDGILPVRAAQVDRDVSAGCAR